VKKGFIAASSRKGGINLGLAERLGVKIWWQGKGGLTISKVQKHIQTMMQYEDPPNFIMLHVGANDSVTCNTFLAVKLFLLIDCNATNNR
jgi:agmatine/peptidylarginine deiminase